MSKATKDQITSEYKQRYSSLSDACIVDVTRLNVKDVTRFRQELNHRKIKLQVIKNSLARRAFEGTALSPLSEGLAGSCALVTGGDSIIDVARALVEARKQFATLELKNAIIEGDAALVSVEDLSKMRGRKEVLGEIAALLVSPARRLAGCLQSAGGKIAGCLKTIADKPEAASEAPVAAG